MDQQLYEEMVNTDCWNGRIVFSARGYQYDLLPNPVFGYYPGDCEKKQAAIFFTPLTVSLMVQTSPDDASIVVEDSLDIISSILEHDIPLTSASNSPTTKILEFRCLGNRFWFGNVFSSKNDVGDNSTNNNSSFDALASILSTYSPGISYERFQPLNLGIQTIQEKVVGGDFSGWTPPPPSEAPPSFMLSTSKKRQHRELTSTAASPGTVSVSTRSSSSASSRSSSSSSSSSSSNSSSSSSTSDASWDYESMMGKASKNNDGSPTRSHKHFGTKLDFTSSFMKDSSHQSNNNNNFMMMDQETQFYSARNYLFSQEAEGRMRIIAEEFVPENSQLISTMKSDFQKLLIKQLEAVQQVNLTTLNSRQSFLDNALEGIPQNYALEEPTSEVVSNFINDLEKSVRVRMSMYLMNGTGPQVIQQRQHAEAQTMYRSLSDQLERLKSQNSQLAVQLAQERRHIGDVESELETTKSELVKARSREQAVLSRMRKREADWAASSGRGGLVVEMMSGENHHDSHHHQT